MKQFMNLAAFLSVNNQMRVNPLLGDCNGTPLTSKRNTQPLSPTGAKWLSVCLHTIWLWVSRLLRAKRSLNSGI